MRSAHNFQQPSLKVRTHLIIPQIYCQLKEALRHCHCQANVSQINSGSKPQDYKKFLLDNYPTYFQHIYTKCMLAKKTQGEKSHGNDGHIKYTTKKSGK